MPSRSTTPMLASIAVVLIALGAANGATTVRAAENRPYDQKLFRLAEILGAIHYLRELCGANEGQGWRSEMETLIDAEGTSAIRRVRLIASFNKGYRSYRRTYVRCNATARTVIDRFLSEGTEIAEGLAATSKTAEQQ